MGRAACQGGNRSSSVRRGIGFQPVFCADRLDAYPTFNCGDEKKKALKPKDGFGA